MKDRYLEITFSNGKALAAYLYFKQDRSAPSARSEKIDDDLIVDYDSNGKPIGLEIVSPSTTSIEQIKAALNKLNIEPISDKDLSPLQAA